MWLESQPEICLVFKIHFHFYYFFFFNFCWSIKPFCFADIPYIRALQRGQEPTIKNESSAFIKSISNDGCRRHIPKAKGFKLWGPELRSGHELPLPIQTASSPARCFGLWLGIQLDWNNTISTWSPFLCFVFFFLTRGITFPDLTLCILQDLTRSQPRGLWQQLA